MLRCNNGAVIAAVTNFPLEIFHDFPNSTTDRGRWILLLQNETGRVLHGRSSRREEVMGLVEAQDLYKRFGSLTAVDGISFKVERGEVVGFLGPNGAGKSTAMKIISGFLAPTSGQAWIDGHNSHTDPIAARRKLGYLPEGPPAYADMSVGAYLGFVAAMHGK